MMNKSMYRSPQRVARPAKGFGASLITTAVFLAGVLTLTITRNQMVAQTSTVSAQPVGVTVRWTGANAPGSVNQASGALLAKSGDRFSGSLPRPPSGVRHYDLHVNYPDGSYPLRLRVYRESDDVDVTVAVDRPKSCADVYLRQLEKPALTQHSAVRAAFTLTQLINRSGENSCDLWPFRAEKARYDRYYNAMENSESLVIPEAIKNAYRDGARTDGDRENVERIIARGDEAEGRRYASILQDKVLAAVRMDNFAEAFSASRELLDAARSADLSAAISKEITLEALEKQTADMAERAEAESADEPSPNQ